VIQTVTAEDGKGLPTLATIGPEIGSFQRTVPEMEQILAQDDNT
jgi:hypothetical protein